MKVVSLYFLVFSVLSVESVMAQASFLFQNYHPLGLDAPVFDSGGNRLFGESYVAVLYGGPTADSLELARLRHLGASMEPVPFTWIPNGQSGYFADAGEVLIESVGGGEVAWLQVRAWDLRLGRTYDDVVSFGMGGYGQSLVFQARGGDPFSDPPRPLLGLQSFSLVPEPSAWALLALGTGFLCWWSRRKT